ncbi:MAG: SprT-like domain-containing protein [Cyclobacteriaceae bacterium]
MAAFTLRNVLVTHLPDKAVDYCFECWKQKPFALKLTKSRHTKAGDFSARKCGYTITLNHDLNRYQFLITYIHEVAHLRVHLKYGRKVMPHGTEWKTEFRQLMQPLLTTEIFPPNLLNCLIAHVQKPKASTFTDTALTTELRLFDSTTLNAVALNELAEGSLFKLRGRFFKKEKLRRTRFYCHEMKTNRKYLVPRMALVEWIAPG